MSLPLWPWWLMQGRFATSGLVGRSLDGPPYIYWGLAVFALIVSYPHLKTSSFIRIPVLGVWIFGAFWWGQYFVAFPADGPSELSVATWNLGRMGEHRSPTGEINEETLACVETAIVQRDVDFWVFLKYRNVLCRCWKRGSGFPVTTSIILEPAWMDAEG